jgi:hypothetical protein
MRAFRRKFRSLAGSTLPIVRIIGWSVPSGRGPPCEMRTGTPHPGMVAGPDRQCRSRATKVAWRQHSINPNRRAGSRSDRGRSAGLAASHLACRMDTTRLPVAAGRAGEGGKRGSGQPIADRQPHRQGRACRAREVRTRVVKVRGTHSALPGATKRWERVHGSREPERASGAH